MTESLAPIADSILPENSTDRDHLVTCPELRLITRGNRLMLAGILLFCFAWAFTLYWRPFTDDLLNLGVTASVGEFVSDRLQNWSSRFAIDAAMLFATRHPFVFRLLTALALWAAIVIPPRFIGRTEAAQKRLTWLALVLVIAIPTNVIFQTGLVATAANYLWALAAGLVAALPALKIARGARVSWEVIPAVLMLIYAISSEIVPLLLLATYAGVFAWRRFGSARTSAAARTEARAHSEAGEVSDPVMLTQAGSLTRTEILTLAAFAAVCLGAIIFHMTNPGNALRSAIETAHQFPTFSELSIWRRAEMGYSNTLRVIFLWRYLPVIVFLATLFFMSIRLARPWWLRVVAFLPLAAALLFSDDFLPEAYYWRIWNQFGLYALNMFRSPGHNAVITFLLLTLLGVAIIVATFGVLGRAAIPVVGVLLAGFASQAVMGFSPTIWGSGNRTHLYLIFAFLIATVMLVAAVMEQTTRFADKAGQEQAAGSD